MGDWGLGIGDWGLGIGDWAQSPIPKSPFFKLFLTQFYFNILKLDKYIFYNFVFFNFYLIKIFSYKYGPTLLVVDGKAPSKVGQLFLVHFTSSIQTIRRGFPLIYA